MSIRTRFNPLGTLKAIEFIDYAKFDKAVSCPAIEGITSSDTTRLRTVVDFYCSALTTALSWDAVFTISYPNQPSMGRWFLYHDALSGGNVKNEWIIENNTAIYGTTPSRAYPLQLDGDNTIDLDSSRAVLNGTTITTRASTAPYTKNASPVKLQFAKTYCIKYKRAQIYLDNVLVQDWRAARKNGKDGMYDVIGKTFVNAK